MFCTRIKWTTTEHLLTKRITLYDNSTCGSDGHKIVNFMVHDKSFADKSKMNSWNRGNF